jgi:hypothetical protein
MSQQTQIDSLRLSHIELNASHQELKLSHRQLQKNVLELIDAMEALTHIVAETKELGTDQFQGD